MSTHRYSIHAWAPPPPSIVPHHPDPLWHHQRFPFKSLPPPLNCGLGRVGPTTGWSHWANSLTGTCMWERHTEKIRSTFSRFVSGARVCMDGWMDGCTQMCRHRTILEDIYLCETGSSQWPKANQPDWPESPRDPPSLAP